MARPTQPRRRRTTRDIEDLPNLFDSVEIDMTRHDIAGEVIDRERARQRVRASADASDQSIEINTEALKRPEAIRFMSFGSGSSGNCAYIGTKRAGLLIDAGVDGKFVEKSLKDNGIDPASIAGILLTHDHSDHVRFAYQLLRSNKHFLLYCTPRSLSGLLRRHSISRRIKDYHKPIYKEITFEAAGFSITAFETSHDGSDNMGFAINRGKHHFVVATDTGVITERADHYMQQANYIMLESNYDRRMLMNGRYPEYLKARVASDRGHLDNVDAAAYVRGLLAGVSSGIVPALTHIFLCHLSEENNTPEIALREMRRAVEETGRTVGDASGSPVSRAADIQIAALPRFAVSPLYIFR